MNLLRCGRTAFGRWVCHQLLANASYRIVDDRNQIRFLITLPTRSVSGLDIRIITIRIYFAMDNPVVDIRCRHHFRLGQRRREHGLEGAGTAARRWPRQPHPQVMSSACVPKWPDRRSSKKRFRVSRTVRKAISSQGISSSRNNCASMVSGPGANRVSCRRAR